MCKENKIKDFTTLSVEEHKKILSWRNSKEVSQWMINKHISLEEHLSFIEKLRNSDSRKYYLIDDLGVIYFTIKGKSAEIGLYKNPEKQKVGTILMNHIIKTAKKLNLESLYLYVFEDNKRAIKLYEKFGFAKTDQKDNIIKMTLPKEKF